MASIPLMIFRPKSAPRIVHCHSELAGIQSRCNDDAATGIGETYKWKVEKAATYHVRLIPSGGEEVRDDPGNHQQREGRGRRQGRGRNWRARISVDQAFEPGKYTVNMKSTDTASTKVKGGYDFFMGIRFRWDGSGRSGRSF